MTKLGGCSDRFPIGQHLKGILGRVFTENWLPQVNHLLFSCVHFVLAVLFEQIDLYLLSETSQSKHAQAICTTVTLWLMCDQLYLCFVTRPTSNADQITHMTSDRFPPNIWPSF